jgi:hypothetical protein
MGLPNRPRSGRNRHRDLCSVPYESLRSASAITVVYLLAGLMIHTYQTKIRSSEFQEAGQQLTGLR